MDKKHFDDVLDYGIFDNHSDLDFDPADMPYNELLKAYKYFTKVKTKDGLVLLFLSKHSSMRPNIGDLGFFNKEKIKDGKYLLSDGEWILQVENGVLKNWLRLEYFKDKHKGVNFQVETIFPYPVQEGNEVFSNGELVADGNYSTGTWESIYVKNGKIIPKNIEAKFYDIISSEKRKGAIYSIPCFVFGYRLLLKATTSTIDFPIIITFIGVLFLGLGTLIIYSCFYFKLKFESDRIIIGYPLLNSPILKKDIKEYLYFDDVLVFFKKNGGKITITSSLYGKELFYKIKKDVSKNYKRLTKREREKFHLKRNKFKHPILRFIFEISSAIIEFIFFIFLLFGFKNLNETTIHFSFIMVIFGALLFLRKFKI